MDVFFFNHDSARINERKLKDVEHVKKLAYLVDLHTVCIGELKEVERQKEK